MVNPYPFLPRDKGNAEMQHFAIHSSVKARYAPENAANSSVITLTPDTTVLELAAVNTPAVMRWVKTTDGTGAATSVISAASGANFDHVIPAGTVVKLAVPIETLYQAPSSMVGANIQNGLYRRIAYKSVGIGSVLLAEF